MVKKEIKKIKRLMAFCLLFIAIGGANFSIGLMTNRWFSIFSGIFCVAVNAYVVMHNVKLIEDLGRILANWDISDTFLGCEKLNIDREENGDEYGLG